MSSHQYLLYHIVFSTKERRSLLKNDEFRASVWSYMAGAAKNLEGFAVAIDGYFDHAHLRVRIPAKLAVADFLGRLKASASKHINETHDTVHKFHWQDGYGAFTVSRSREAAIVRYIENRMEHHTKLSFKEEFLMLLEHHEIEYDLKYLWE